MLVNTRFIPSLSLISLLIFPSLSSALPDDRNQPINIEANEAEKNDKKGITTYKGNVVITQGSIRMSGDLIIVYDNNGTVEKIVSKGKPAHFKQKPDLQSEDMIAEALNLEYDINKETLLLEEKALLKQNGGTTNSNKIIYDMKTAVVNAGTGNSSGRVIMVIPPSK